MPDADPKLCLSCARARLAGEPPRACASCALINVDPLAKVRANAAKPSPFAAYSFPELQGSSWDGGLPGSWQTRPHRGAE